MDRDCFGGVEGIVWKALQFSWKKKIEQQHRLFKRTPCPLFFLIVLQWIKDKLGSKNPRDFKKINNKNEQALKKTKDVVFAFLKKLRGEYNSRDQGKTCYKIAIIHKEIIIYYYRFAVLRTSYFPFWILTGKSAKITQSRARWPDNWLNFFSEFPQSREALRDEFSVPLCHVRPRHLPSTCVAGAAFFLRLRRALRR